MTMKKILLTGASGQLGKTFNLHFAHSYLLEKYSLLAFDRSEFDLSKEESISSFLSLYKPSVIINCGAYTAVDDAETESELAIKVNDEAVGRISSWASENDCRLIHISTDFVFDGASKKPYLPTDPAVPIGVYGKTKRAGEKHVLDSLADSGVIIRTSWLYSEFRRNFVRTMIRLMSEKPDIGIVKDQIGSPTSTHSLARVILKVIEQRNIYGILHWCDGASISWYDFALEIQRVAHEHGLLEKKIPLKPLMTLHYPTKAARPSYSVLDRNLTLEKLGMINTDWRIELEKVVKRILGKKKD